MFDIGGGEIIFILLAILLLFGPKKIPEVMQMFGKGMREFRKAQDNLRQQIRDISTEVETTVNIEEKNISPKKNSPDINFSPEENFPQTSEEIDPAHETLPMNFTETPNENSAEQNFPKPEIRPAESIVARPSRRIENISPKENIPSDEKNSST